VIKRMVNDSKAKAASSGKGVGGGGVSIRNKGMTPIPIKPTYNKDEVQATDATRTSVAKLSSDNHQKGEIIRRGANVIAKSRKFGKGLANMIVEQNKIRSGSVASKKDWLEISRYWRLHHITHFHFYLESESVSLLLVTNKQAPLI
jgi:hypothetical protein